MPENYNRKQGEVLLFENSNRDLNTAAPVDHRMHSVGEPFTKFIVTKIRVTWEQGTVGGTPATVEFWTGTGGTGTKFVDAVALSGITGAGAVQFLTINTAGQTTILTSTDTGGAGGTSRIIVHMRETIANNGTQLFCNVKIYGYIAD